MKGINNVINYIETHLEEPISYEYLSGMIGYSTFYFHRIFTMLFGMTVGEYIRYRRLTKAADLIKETNQSVLEIAYLFQYQTPEGFTKAFKSFHGCSPIKMRQEKAAGKQV